MMCGATRPARPRHGPHRQRPVALAGELAKAVSTQRSFSKHLWWYWAADVITSAGATCTGPPLGNNWGHRRVKNDERDATDLVDLCVSGLPKPGGHRAT